MTFSESYRDLLKHVMTFGVTEYNKRTGSNILAAGEGASFVVDLTDGYLPTCGLRKTYPHIAAAELAWCIRGDCHIDWLRRHTRVWDDFADVVTCLNCGGDGNVNTIQDVGVFDGPSINVKCDNCDGSGKVYWLDAAYGYRWRVKFGRDQLMDGVTALRADSSNRRVWISSWDPTADKFDGQAKTVPCPVGFTLSILNGWLNSTLMIRSSDLYMGLPYDVMRHCLLMDAVARSLNINAGCARFTLAHPHIYERHFELVGKMLTNAPVEPLLHMPRWSVESIEKMPDDYVASMRSRSRHHVWPSFNPKTEVVK